jgi:ABC-type multidrug transport system ATPase subunit
MANPAEYRRHLSIVSQEPLLFNSSVRENVDPCDVYTDERIEDVLRQVGLWDKVSEMGGLAKVGGAQVSPNASNFSVGQRQLLSMARAVLRQTPVLVLDEATASCDVEGDQMIQDTVGRLCAANGTTVITIAHRLSTIMDYDKIAVLDNGNIVEFGRPRDLVQDPCSWFSALAAAGDVLDSDEAASPDRFVSGSSPLLGSPRFASRDAPSLLGNDAQSSGPSESNNHRGDNNNNNAGSDVDTDDDNENAGGLKPI